MNTPTRATIKAGAVACGLALGAITSPPAQADAVSSARMQLLCATNLCLYDQNGSGQIVGVPFPSSSSYGAIARFISGSWYGINDTGKDGIAPELQFFYSSPGCVGTPYLASGKGQLPFAQYDGHSIWAGVGPDTTFQWRSIFTVIYGSSIPANSCYSDANCGVTPGYNCSFTGAEAHVIEQRTFVAPFKVKGAGGF